MKSGKTLLTKDKATHVHRLPSMLKAFPMIVPNVKFVIFFVHLKVLKTCVWCQDLLEMVRKFILLLLISKQSNKQPWLLILFRGIDCIEMTCRVCSLVMRREKTKIEFINKGKAKGVAQMIDNLIEITVVETVKPDKKNKIG